MDDTTTNNARRPTPPKRQAPRPPGPSRYFERVASKETSAASRRKKASTVPSPAAGPSTFPPARRNPLLADAPADPVVDPEVVRQAHLHRVRRSEREIRDARRIKTAAEAVAGIGLDGREVYGLTRGQFSFIDVIEATLGTTGPAHLDLCTWTATGPHIARTTGALADGRLTGGRFLVDVSFTRRCPQEAAAIRSAFGPDSIRVTKTHAKFAIITADPWRVVVQTSMNLNTNPRLESFTVAQDPELADFLTAAMDDIWHSQTRGLQAKTIRTVSKWWNRHG